jgi:hypothetical protein
MEQGRRAPIPHQRNGFDEIRITTVPRYKCSNASGNEWRTSYSITFMKKGEPILQDSIDGMECLRTESYVYDSNEIPRVDVVYINDLFNKKCDIGTLLELSIGKGDLCDQVGCSDTSTVIYKLKYRYIDDGNYSLKKIDPYIEDKRPLIRKFCDRHSIRGDCGFEDSDDNYEIIKGNPVEPLKKDVSVSTTMFV